MNVNRIAIRRTALVLATCLALATATTASAQEVTDIRVLANEDSTESVNVLPEGTESFLVAFDYAGLSGTAITVDVSLSGVPRVFLERDTYSGSGTALVEVTGEAIFSGLADLTLDSSELVVEYLERAQAEEPSPEDANTVQRGVSSLRGLTSHLLTLPSGATGVDMDAMADTMAELDGLAREIERVSVTDPEWQDTAQRMEDPAARMVGFGTELVAAANGASGVPLPLTDDSEGAAYTINVRIGSTPADEGVQLWIYGDTAGQAEAPGNGPTPTRITRSGDDGASPTRTPTRRTSASRSTPGASGEDDATDEAASGTRRDQVQPMSGATATAFAQRQAAGESDGQPPLISGLATDDPFGEPPPVDENPDPMVQSGVSEGPAFAQPTWTVPAGAGDASEEEPEEGAPGGSGSGPNITILALGIAVLGAMAIFVRRRFM